MDESGRRWASWLHERTSRRSIAVLVSVCLLAGAFGLGRASATWGQPAEEAPGAEDGAVGRTMAQASWFAHSLPRSGERGLDILELGGNRLACARAVAWYSSETAWARSIALAQDGTPYIVSDSGTGGSTVARYGLSLASRTEASMGYSSVTGVAVSPNGSVYVSSEMGGITRYSPDLSSHSNEAQGNWRLCSITIAPDGTVYAAGAEDTSDDYAFVSRATIRRYSAELRLMAEARFEGIGESRFESVTIAPDGTVLVLANVGEGGRDEGGVVIRYDQELTEVSKARLGGEDVSFYRDIVVVPDGSLYILGVHSGNEPNALSASLVIKLGSDLVEVGRTVLSSYKEDLVLKALAAAPDGSVYAAGCSELSWYAFIIRYGSNLEVLGSGVRDDTKFFDVAVAPDGSAYVAGYDYSRGRGRLADPLVERYYPILARAQ